MLEQLITPIKNSSCWKERTRLEQTFIITTVIMLLILIILAAVKINAADSNRNTCLSPRCVQTAAEILERLDSNTSPCDDFYTFACGTFLKNTFPPDDKPELTAFTQASEATVKALLFLIEKPVQSADIKSTVLAKTLYQACMNTTQLEAQSVDYLRRVIKSAGGWPLLDGSAWNGSAFNWMATSRQIKKIGFLPNAFIELDTFLNASVYRLKVGQNQMDNVHLIRKGISEPLTSAYKDYIMNVALALGAYKPTLIEDVEDLIAFTIELARITVPEEEARAEKPIELTIRQLEEKYPYVQWLEFINLILEPYAKKGYDDIIAFENPRYYETLGDLLKRTRNRTLANYMLWDVVKTSIPFLNNQLIDLEYLYKRAISDVQIRPERWKECIESVVNQMPVAVGALYVRNVPTKTKESAVSELFENIQESFRSTIEKADWMDKSTKAKAQSKLKSMKLRSTPEELFDDDKLNEYYRTLHFNASNYLQNGINSALFYYLHTFTQLDRVVDNNDWKNHAYVAQVGAQMDLKENKIEIVASILQGAFFSVDNPHYLNYGAIGYVIGHEMTHGFDDVGRFYDENGNLLDWWDHATKSVFDKKAQCFVDQYSNITEPKVNLKLNGLLSQGENIADNGGLKQAYFGYKKWMGKNAAEQSLPGLPYTNEQMFWISAANIYCAVETKEYLRAKVLAIHPPERYRINVPLMNSEQFSNDFKCPPGSPMNPHEKCAIW